MTKTPKIKKYALGILLVIIVAAVGWFATGHIGNSTPNNNISDEYTDKDIQEITAWYAIKPPMELLEKSQAKEILLKFNQVQKDLVSKNTTFSHAGDVESHYGRTVVTLHPLSEIINKFDPRLTTDPEYKGSLNETNTIIVQGPVGYYNALIYNPPATVLYLYRTNKDSTAYIKRFPIIIDPDTTRILYAQFSDDLNSGRRYDQIKYGD